MLLSLRVLYLQTAYAFGLAGVRRHHLESWIGVAWIVTAAVWALHWRSASVGRRRQPVRLSMIHTLAIASAILYAPAFALPLLSDDHILLDWATHNQFVAAFEPFVRPFLLLIWRLASWTSSTAAVLHGLNVLLHSLNAVLVVLLLVAVGSAPWFALIGGAVFAAWPTQVEAVAWASGMFDVLMTTLTLAVCVTYARAEGRLDVRRTTIVACLALAALFTKETVVCLPALLVVLSFDRWRRDGLARGEALALAILTAAAAGYLSWRLGFRRTVEVAPHPMLTKFAVKQQLAVSFGGLGLPLISDVIERHAWIALLFMATTFGIGQAALLAAQRRESRSQTPIVGAGIWIVAAALPAMGLLFVGDHLDGSRHLYLPCVGLAMYLAHSCETLFEYRRALGIAAAALLVALVAIAVRQDRALLENWRVAGVIQQSALEQAARAAQNARCAPAHIEGAPDVYRGTQVLRNGAIEAFREAYPLLANAPRPSCTLVRTGDRFVAR